MSNNSSPVILDFDTGKLFGIFRGSYKSKKLVIMCPAATGNRIGPQRIYVEISQRMCELNLASYSFDFPPFGDSFDNAMENYKGVYSEKLSQHYSKYIQIVIEYFTRKFHFNEFVLLSISDGCIPIYNYAKNNNVIRKLILLSPNHLLDTVQSINTNNLKKYYIKLFNKETWLKLIFLRLNLKKIVKNIYQSPKGKKIGLVNVNEKENQKKIDSILVVFGEKEPKLNECLKFWDKENKNNNIGNYSYNIIKGADHSFFGWKFKRDVEKCVVDWLSVDSD